MYCKKALLNILKAGGSKPVSKEEFEYRIGTCLKCEHSEGKGTELKCKECGCCMMAKAKFTYHILENFGKTEIKCPLGFWKPQNNI